MKLGLPGIDIEVQEDRNAMQMGEFEVIKELLEAFPAAKIAKAQVDKLIDLAAPPPRGTGVENIRECIIESKMTFDVSSDDWQAIVLSSISTLVSLSLRTSSRLVTDSTSFTWMESLSASDMLPRSPFQSTRASPAALFASISPIISSLCFSNVSGLLSLFLSIKLIC